jgi:alcohol dehydrogenase class IV
MPVRVIMSQDCVLNHAALIKDYGQKACIVTGINSAKNNGALQDVTQVLTTLGISYVIFDRVMANPTISCAYEGASFARENEADFIIGIGGGSPMDAAKAIALLAVQDIPEEKLFLNQFGDDVLPVIMIPTTAGTGSEVTSNSILTSDKLQTKKGISAPILFPKLALLDAKYTKNLPMNITINTALDALSHAVEGMLSVRATVTSNLIATESIKMISQCLKHLAVDTEQKLSMDIREKLLYGSMLAGMVIAHTGTTAVHSMGYSLTYFKNIDHGRANALILPGFLRFIAKSIPDTVEKILIAMGIESIDEFETIFLELTGEHESVTMKDVERFTEIASAARNVSNSKAVPTKDDILNLYIRSLQIMEYS